MQESKQNRKLLKKQISDGLRGKMAKENEVKAEDLVGLDFEYQAAIESVGQDKVYGFWGFLWKIWNRFVPEKKPHQVRKKTYLLLMLFTGWIGGHRYYERRWVLGLIYSALFWSGIPFSMTVIDAMIAIPIKADEQGMIWL